MDDATRVEEGCMHGWGAQLFSTREDATFADKSRQIGRYDFCGNSVFLKGI